MFEQRRLAAHARVLPFCDVIIKGKVRELPLSLITCPKNFEVISPGQSIQNNSLSTVDHCHW